MHITHLGLRRFRNFPRLDLSLGPGPSLLSGDNGNGKSNLLEALYMLAVAKSPRAGSDRDLIGFGPAHAADDEAPGQLHTSVSAVVRRGDADVRISIDLVGADPAGSEPREEAALQKAIRVNGAPRRAADLVGELNAVLFSAQDLDLVYGPPALRRRYLDVLISQHDREYLRALQRYQRALTQRNHLLRAIGEGRSAPGELGPWDDRLALDGGYVTAARVGSMDALAARSAALFGRLSDGPGALGVSYRPSFPAGAALDAESAAGALSGALARSAGRDAARGHTGVGPHRDDVAIEIGGSDAARFASRGQVRTGVLALKLAEARYLSEARGEAPVVLLDDVLSELDPGRRELVLERAAGYDQCLITTPEPESLPPALSAAMRRYAVGGGTVTAI